MAKRYRANLTWKPILLGGLFRNIGSPNIPLFAMSEAKRKYQLKDLQDWAKWWKVDFNFPDFFPIRTVLPLRVSIVEPEATSVLYRKLWKEGKDISSQEVVEDALNESGMEVEETLERSQSAPIKAQLRRNTMEAETLGAFGVPTTILEGELWWGQDRLFDLARRLSAS